MRGMHPPTSHFQKCFDAYNLSIISNLFHCNKPYAFSTYIENVGTKCIIGYLAKHSELGSKNLNKFCVNIIQKALK